MRLTLIAFALAGCSRKDKTSVVVVINSHDIAPEDVTGVAVAITINQTKNIELPVAGAWPVKFVLTPAAKASETFALTVAAYKDIPANVVVSSGVISEFSPGQVGVVEIWLDRACVGVTCASDDKVCVMGTCDSDKKQPFRQWKPKDGAQDAGVANDGGVGAADAATCVGTESICELNTPVTCVAGFLVVEPECAGRCESGVCLDECRATQKKCDGRDQYECIEGKWARAMTCPFACQGGSCSGECREGERKCLDKAAMVCDAVTHKFVSDKDCAGQCMGGFCAGECTASEIRCNGKTPYVCQSDKTWKASDECSFLQSSRTARMFRSV